MDINAELLKLQHIWQEGPYKKLYDKYESSPAEHKDKLSCAFSFGVSEHYKKAERRLMIIGQEANGHTIDYEKWGFKSDGGAEEFQRWTIAYLDSQVYGGRKYKKNGSPFWRFFAAFGDMGCGVCWSNIDKARRYVYDEKTNEYKERFLQEERDSSKIRDRSILHEKIFDNGTKSLLQKEIEIAKPDAVVFVVGPTQRYYHSLCSAFFDGKVDGKLNAAGKYPDINDDWCVEIGKDLGLDIPAFYTYHPRYLASRGLIEETVKRVFEALKNHG